MATSVEPYISPFKTCPYEPRFSSRSTCQLAFEYTVVIMLEEEINWMKGSYVKMTHSLEGTKML